MYGVLGDGSSPRDVIVQSLTDLQARTDVTAEYLIPWYGNITEGLEAVYDFVLDNNVTFSLVVDSAAPKKAPSVLRTMAERVVDSEDVDRTIVNMLAPKHGYALVLWNEDAPELCTAIAQEAITKGLPTLELTNGLVPIVFDDAVEPDMAISATDDLMVETDSDEGTEWSREMLDNMPAAVVKRMAQNAGTPAKTKEEAIKALLGDEEAEEEDPTSKWVSVPVERRENINEEFALVDAEPVEDLPYKITVESTGGRVMSFYGTNEILKKMMDVVVSEISIQ